MSNAQAEKMKLSSMDIAEEKRDQLKRVLQELLPEAANGSGIDFDQLKRALGEWAEPGKERFGLQWPGKAEGMKIIQQPSVATLRPMREESVNFDETENLFIEGDNLEVLKLLQKPYFGKVKMIYIDPPYNTGREFIYPDKFAETLDTYLDYTGQKDAQGHTFSTNVESSGRYHSRWLSMMYPRLYLARNLLRDDGVIFISINDKEIHNLRALLDLTFGEENFLATLVWDKNHSAQAGVFKVYHEYILVYSKNIEQIETPKSSNSDLFEAGAMKRESSRHPMTEFSFPAGVRFEAEHGTELTNSWGGTEKVELIKGRMICDNGFTKEPVTLRAAFTQKNQMQQFFYGDRETLIDSRGQKITEFYFTASGKIKIIKERGVETPQTTLKDYGSQGAISTELASLFGLDESPLENPKSPNMMKDFISWFTEKDDLVLDFFAGSGTTAHGVYLKNLEDQGNRKFILVQLPEKSADSSTAYKAGYSTIADLSKERIRRAGTKLAKSVDEELALEGEVNFDFGFKVFKLDRSNFKIWEGSVEQANNLEKQLSLHVDHIAKASTPEDILYELLLKAGFSLTTKVEKVKIAGKEVFSIHEGALLICLEKELTQQLIDALAEANPVQVICLDEGFNGNDQLKANAVQTFKARAQAEESEIVFKTV